MIDPGKMRWRAVFQSRTTTTDSEGSVIVTYADAYTRWVEKLEVSGSEARRAGAVRAEVTLALKMRYQSGIVTEQSRVYFEGRYYDVVSVEPNQHVGEMLVQAKYTEGSA